MKRGFTIIEFLIYIVILAIAVAGISLIVSNIFRVGARTDVIQEVSHNGRFAMQRMGQIIKESSVIVEPQVQGNVLEIKDLDDNSTIFYVSGGKLKIAEEEITSASSTNYPGTVATEAVAPEDDSSWWAGIDNIKADDDLKAGFSGAEDNFYTYRLKATNFGFSIPAEATIDGIMVEIERCANYADKLKDYRVQLLDGNGNLVGDNKAKTSLYWPWSSTYDCVHEVYGDNNNAWNAFPDADMVNDPDFGVVFSANIESSAVGVVDFIRMTVYYTEGGVPLTTSKVSVNRIFFKKIADDSVKVEMNISSNNPQNLPEYEFNSFFTSSFTLAP